MSLLFMPTEDLHIIVLLYLQNIFLSLTKILQLCPDYAGFWTCPFLQGLYECERTEG